MIKRPETKELCDWLLEVELRECGILRNVKELRVRDVKCEILKRPIKVPYVIS